MYNKSLLCQCIGLQLADLLEGRRVISNLGTSSWGALGEMQGGLPSEALDHCLFVLWIIVSSLYDHCMLVYRYYPNI